MTDRLFREEALLFAGQHALGGINIVQPVANRIITVFLMITSCVALVYLWMGDYARKETVHGYLDPLAGVVDIYPRERGAVVRSILVSRGEEVEAGQPLMEVAFEIIDAKGKDTFVEISNGLASRQRQLNDQMGHHDLFFRREKQRLQNHLAEFDAELGQQGRFLSLQQRRVALTDKLLVSLQKLRETGAIAEVEWLQTVSEKYEQEKEIVAIQQKTIQLQSAREATSHQLVQLPIREANEKLRTQLELSAVEQQLVEVASKRETLILAPVDGRVSSLQAKVGNPTETGLPLLSILPRDSELESILLLPSSAVGFADIGQEVKLKFAAYPHQRFGAQPARLVSISETPVKAHELLAPIRVTAPVYVARARLERNFIKVMGKQRILQPGMLLSADIILERRSLMDWLLEPLHNIKGRRS